MTRKILTLLVCALMLPAQAAVTVLWGTAPEYAGQTLRLTTPHDGLSLLQTPLAEATVESDGTFRFEAGLDHTCLAAIELGGYSGRIYLEPGTETQVELPPFRPLTEAQQFNPYFRPKAVLLSIVDPRNDDLNVRLEAFDEVCDSVWSELLFEPNITPELIERGLTALERQFPSEKEDFFYRYKRYNYAMLVNLYVKASPQLAIETYFMHDSVDYANPAWWEAFDLVFEVFDRAEVLRGNQPLYELVQTNRVIRRKLPVSWLDSVTTPRLIPMAEELRRQLTAGTAGSSVGSGWVDLQGDSIPAADPYGRPTYLVFANRRIFESQSDLTYVAQLAKKWEHKCRFIVVFAQEPEIPRIPPSDDVGYLCTQHNPDITAAFGVRALPCYYLLDGEGRIELAPAPDPEHYLPE